MHGTICLEVANGDVGTLEVSAEASSQRVTFVAVKLRSIIGRDQDLKWIEKVSGPSFGVFCCIN